MDWGARQPLYSPCGHKESGTTEATWHTQRQSIPQKRKQQKHHSNKISKNEVRIRTRKEKKLHYRYLPFNTVKNGVPSFSCVRLCDPLDCSPYWNGWPFASPGDLPHARIEPASHVSPALQADSLSLSQRGGSGKNGVEGKKRKYLTVQINEGIRLAHSICL